MVMDTESKYARPVAHLYKGQTFGVSFEQLFDFFFNKFS